jgi:hypothetical protein
MPADEQRQRRRWRTLVLALVSSAQQIERLAGRLYVRIVLVVLILPTATRGAGVAL